MPRTIEVKVYKFDELAPDAQEKAIQRFMDLNTVDDLWENVYYDAKEVGVSIKEFDVDHYCKIAFIEGALYTAHKIIELHGDQTETFKTSEVFLKERDEIVATAPTDEDGNFEDEYELDTLLDERENEYKKSIAEDYRIMLRKEYEYLTSRQAIVEAIQANEYEYYASGKAYN